MVTPYFYRERDFIDDFQCRAQLSSVELKELEYQKIIINNSKKKTYQWNIVGFIVIKNDPIIIFPELYKSKLSLTETDALLLLDVFRKYCNSSDLGEEEQSYFYGSSGRKEAKVALALYFFKDFKIYGLLNRLKSEIKQNEYGLINWSKTTTQQVPITTHHSAFYPSPFVRQRLNNYNSVIRRLHEWILYDASLKWGWLDRNFMYEMDSDFPCTSFRDAILILKQELRTTFQIREIKLIKNMIAYLTDTASTSDRLICDYYYTPFFHHIWEKMCGYALDNDYKNLSPIFIPETKIEYFYDNKLSEKRKQIPDILLIHNNTFYIFDAKYYVGGTFPGWSDIMKQYVYFITIQEMLKVKKLNYSMHNAFLLPGNVANIQKFAQVSTEYIPQFNIIDSYYVNVEWMMNIFVGKVSVDNFKLKLLDNYKEGLPL